MINSEKNGNNENLSHVKTNWDGEKIDLEKPWFDETLFSIGDAKITNATVVEVSGGLIAAVASVFAIMSFIAYRKRKVIEKSARRLSETIVRASVNIRNSIRGTKSLPGVD